MNRMLTFATNPNRQLSPGELRPLLVSGAQRATQERRLRTASILIREGRRIVAAAVWRGDGDGLRVEELGILTSQPSDDLADQVIDMFETAALAGGYPRLVVCSTAGEIRRALRLLGYIPQTQARRLCFIRQMDRLPENRQPVESRDVSTEDNRSK